MITLRSCDDLAALMASDSLFAVFDVRERGEFNQGQIPHATSLPRSQIEFRIAELVPKRSVPIMLYDDSEERTPLAAKTMVGLGFDQVSILQGGLTAWRGERRAAVSGVNVPSKAFGEKIHHETNVPDISPQELKSLLDSSAKPVILDVRTPEEYGRFCIPSGSNIPGGDLILWAEELRQKPAVIVNCAGRTRSIIGTAALRRLGLTNVRALRNGTMGWVLSGFELETKPGRQTPPAPPTSREAATALALRIAKEEGIPRISPQQVMNAMADSNASVTYLIDVRAEGEYAAGHVAGSINMPGGQAVQRADDFVAVRNARIIFISNQSSRAVMAAYWYRQMGFSNVYVLHGGLDAWTESGAKLITGIPANEPLGIQTAKQAVRYIEAKALERIITDSSVLVLDVGTSLDFEAAHVPGARWISRGWIEIRFPERFPDRNQPIVVTCPDGRQSTFAARTLTEIGYADVTVLNGGLRACSKAGLPTENGLNACLMEPNDVVLSPSVRGNKEDMQRYLDWETKLPR